MVELSAASSEYSILISYGHQPGLQLQCILQYLWQDIYFLNQWKYGDLDDMSINQIPRIPESVFALHGVETKG